MDYGLIVVTALSALAALFTWLSKRKEAAQAEQLLATSEKGKAALEKVLEQKNEYIHELETALLRDATPADVVDILNRVYSAGRGGKASPVRKD